MRKWSEEHTRRHNLQHEARQKRQARDSIVFHSTRDRQNSTPFGILHTIGYTREGRFCAESLERADEDRDRRWRVLTLSYRLNKNASPVPSQVRAPPSRPPPCHNPQALPSSRSTPLRLTMTYTYHAPHERSIDERLKEQPHGGATARSQRIGTGDPTISIQVDHSRLNVNAPR